MKSVFLFVLLAGLSFVPLTTNAQIDLSPLDNWTPVGHPPPLPYDKTRPAKDPETAEEFYELARWLFNNEYYEYAIKDLGTAIGLKPDFAMAYELRGRAYLTMDRCKDTVKDVATALEILPALSEPYYLRAKCKLKEGDYLGALSDLDQAIHIVITTKKPRPIPYFEMRGKVRYILGDYSGAIEDFTPLYPPKYYTHQVFYRALTYMKARDDANALKDLTFLAGFFTNLPINSEFMRRRALEYPNGENPFSRDPKYNSPYSYCSKMGLPGSPTFDDEIAPEYWFMQPKPKGYSLPNRDIIHYFLGTLQEKNGDIEKAIESYTFSLDSKYTQNSPSRLRRGKLYLAIGQFEPAIRDLSWAICGTTDPAEAHLERGIAILSLGREDIAQADFDKFLVLNPGGESTLQSRIQKAKGLGGNVAERP